MVHSILHIIIQEKLLVDTHDTNVYLYKTRPQILLCLHAFGGSAYKRWRRHFSASMEQRLREICPCFSVSSASWTALLCLLSSPVCGFPAQCEIQPQWSFSSEKRLIYNNLLPDNVPIRGPLKVVYNKLKIFHSDQMLRSNLSTII